MADPSSTTSQKRLGERAHVRRAAVVIERRKRFGRVKEERITAEVRDVSMTGALLALPAGTPLQVGMTCDLEINRQRGRIRVRRVDPPEAELLCGVEFADPRPPFLPTIYQWIGREGAVDDPSAG